MNVPRQKIEQLLARVPRGEQILQKVSIPESVAIPKSISLNAAWSELFRRYEIDHQNDRNQAMHKIGIPLIAASIPTAATVVGAPLAAGLFTVGWAVQFAGHHFEGNDPSFFGDRRYLIVGLIWWAKKWAGLEVKLTDAEVDSAAEPATATA